MFAVKLEEAALLLSQQISSFMSYCKIYLDSMLQIQDLKKKDLGKNKTGVFSLFHSYNATDQLT